MGNSTAGLNPVSPPPAGWVPKFDYPEDAGRILNYTVTTVCIAIVTFFFLIRMYTRVRARNVLVDDWTCLLAYISLMVYAGTVYVMTSYGEGYHAWEVRRDNYSEMLRWLYASSVIYNPMSYITKVTLLLMTARVFSVKASAARAIYILIGVLFVCYLPMQILKTFICSPIYAYWDFDIQEYKCLAQRKIFFADTSLAIVTDLIVLLIPIPLTWSLRIPIRKKLRIIALLGMGGVAAVVAMYRTYEVVRFEHSEDVTADFVILDLLCIVEISIGILCSCLPSCNILIERYRRRRSSSTAHLQPRSSWFSERAARYHRRIVETVGGTFWDDRDDDSAVAVSHNFTTTTTTDSSSKPFARSVHTARRSSDVDVERAMAIGQPLGDGGPMRVPSCVQPIRYPGEAPPPLSSSEVRCEAGEGSGVHAMGMQGGAIMKTVEISLELSELDAKQEWTGIWDGTKNGQGSAKGEG